MDPHTYLQRIGYDGPRAPGPETVRRIHRAHMLAVPFENLDIPLGRPIELSVAAFYDKIVRHRRGGFCYELNGLFGWLLEQLGYPVTLLSGRVFRREEPGARLRESRALVEAGERLIADVGFGDSLLEPLRLDETAEVEHDGTRYRLREFGDGRVLERLRAGAGWEPQFCFTLTPRRLAEFGAECLRLQTSPESSFTRKAVCSLPTTDGRVTLSGDRLIRTRLGRRIEEVVADPRQYRAVLRGQVGLELDPGASVERLIALRPL